MPRGDVSTGEDGLMELSDVASMEPLEGGWSGETFVAEVAGDRVVVRMFAGPQHGPHAAEVYEAVLRLVRGLLPVPGVVDLHRAVPEAGRPALLLTEWLDGVRGDVLLEDLVRRDDDTALRTMGEAVGRVAATLAGMPQLSSGLFTAGDLSVEPFRLDLPAWVADHEARLGWSEPDLVGLRVVADGAQDLLDSVGRISLVHSDLNPKNLLIDPESLAVAGVLDWEYAHAGHPFTDLGNLLRFDRHPAYVDGVLAGYVALRGGDPGWAQDVARAADLAALVELAARRQANPVAARAHDRLLAIARTGDVHAQ